MLRRSIVSRAAALALMLTPALAFAAPSATQHPMKNGASCDCGHIAPSAAKTPTGSSSTSEAELQRIWSNA